jgi:FkbM family methyltransferase
MPLKSTARNLVRRLLGPEATLSDAPMWVLRRFWGETFTVRTKNGFPLIVNLRDSYVGSSLIRRRTHEEATTAFLRTLVRAGDAALDIGANIGYFTILLGRAVGSAGRVIAFEPDAISAEILRKNVRLNSLDGVVQVIEAAASSEPGSATLYGLPNHAGNSSIVDFTPVGASRAEMGRIATRPVDDVLGATVVDVVKIDVEGAEQLVLAGMIGTLERSPGVVVVCEIAPRWLGAAGTSGREILETFAAIGMRGYRILSDGTVRGGDVLGHIDRLLEIDSNDNLMFTRDETFVKLRALGRIREAQAPRQSRSADAISSGASSQM